MKNRLYIVLIYTLLLSFLVAAASMARYKVTGSGSDNAVVAQAVFDYVPLHATLNGVPIGTINGGISVGNVQPGAQLVYNFQINNYKGANLNQVLLKYYLSVGFNPSSQVIPLTYTLQPNSTYPSAGSGWVYLGYDTATSQGYTLTVDWSTGSGQGTYTNQSQTVFIQLNVQQADNYS